MGSNVLNALVETGRVVRDADGSLGVGLEGTLVPLSLHLGSLADLYETFVEAIEMLWPGATDLEGGRMLVDIHLQEDLERADTRSAGCNTFTNPATLAKSRTGDPGP